MKHGRGTLNPRCPGQYVPTTKERRRTLGDLVDKYIREAIPKKVHNKDQRNLATRLEWWKEQIGHRYLAEIRPSDIAECRDKLEAKTNRYGKHLSGATINRYLAAIGAAYKHAVKEWHWVESSPVGNVARRGESAGPDPVPRRRRTQTSDGRGEDSRQPDIYPAVLLAITTGMRKGEILSLRWPQIDLKRSLVQLVDTKNGEARTVPVPKIAADLLTERGKVRSLTDDRLFTDPRDFDRCWRETLAAAEIADFRFHDRVILPRPISPCTARRWPSWPKSSGTRRCRW